jgi:hypothetical protein
MYTCDADVGQVHAHLSYAIFLYEPTYGFGSFECTRLAFFYHSTICLRMFHYPTGLTHIKGYGIGTAGTGGI